MLSHLFVWLHALCQVCACLRLSRVALHSICSRDCVITARLSKATWQIHTCALTYQSRQGLHWTNRTQTKHTGRYTQAHTHHAGNSSLRSCLKSDLRVLPDLVHTSSSQAHTTARNGVTAGKRMPICSRARLCRSRLHVSRPGATAHDQLRCTSVHGRQPALCGDAGCSMQPWSKYELMAEALGHCTCNPKSYCSTGVHASQHTLDV